MAIINARKKVNDGSNRVDLAGDADSSLDEPLIIEKENPPPAPQYKKPRPKKPARFVLPVFIVLILACVGGGAYYIFNHTELTRSLTQKPVIFDAEEAALEINRFVKLGGIISLVEEEIEVNTITLIEAENTGSSVAMNAVEIILNKKKQELSELREKAVAALETLYELNQLDQKRISSIINEEIKLAEREELEQNIELLETALDALNSVPPIVSPKKHFRGMIEARM